MKRFRVYIGWGLSLLIIGSAFIYLGPTVFGQLVRADPGILFLALLTTAVVLLTSALRWQMILSYVTDRHSPPFLALLYYVLIGATVGLFVPRDIGEMSTRIAAMKLFHQIDLRKVTLSVLVDRFFDLIILIPFTLAALPFLGGYTISLLALAAWYGTILVLSLGLIGSRPTYEFTFNLVRRFYDRFYAFWNQKRGNGRLGLTQPRTFKLLHTVLSPGLVVGAFCLTTIKFFSLALRAYLVAWALDLDIGFETMLFSTPLAQASLILAFTPGGLGFNELGWYGALTILNTDAEAVPPFLVGHRLFNYGFVLVLALITQILYLLISRKNFARKLLSERG